MRRSLVNVGEHHSGHMKRESAQPKPERIIVEELKWRKWAQQKLGCRARSDLEKLAMADRLRRETALTWPQVAEQPHMNPH